MRVPARVDIRRWHRDLAGLFPGLPILPGVFRRDEIPRALERDGALAPPARLPAGIAAAMKPWVRVLIAAIVLGSCGARPVAADAPATESPALTQVLGLFAARHQGHVAFTEVHELAMLKKPVASSGELLYVAPDRLEKRTLAPKPESLVLARGMLTAERGHHQYVVALSAAPQVVPFVESVRATLAGDRPALERYFTIRFEGDLEHWRLTLIPRDATLAKSVKQLLMVGERDAIHTVEVRESDGDRSLLTLGPELPP